MKVVRALVEAATDLDKVGFGWDHAVVCSEGVGLWICGLCIDYSGLLSYLDGWLGWTPPLVGLAFLP